MSRIGKSPVSVPASVNVSLTGQDIVVKGPKGELSFVVHDEVIVSQEEGAISFKPRNESRLARALWATMRTCVQNMVVGVSTGYSKTLEIHGVGYKANLQGSNLVLNLGYSHDVVYPVPSDIQISVDKQTVIVIHGVDKQKVGQVAAEIIKFRPPEPYKGKGIRHAGQYILRKEGKKK